MLIEDIYQGAARLINKLIIEEFRAQGHSLTGAFEASLRVDLIKNSRTATLSVTGLAYGLILNQGLSPDQVSDKMIPGLIQYFVQRGYGAADSIRIAHATLRKWKVEGMSTQASKRFSSTGSRQHFIEAALVGHSPVIDGYMEQTMEHGIEEAYRKTKSETI